MTESTALRKFKTGGRKGKKLFEDFEKRKLLMGGRKSKSPVKKKRIGLIIDYFETVYKVKNRSSCFKLKNN